MQGDGLVALTTQLALHTLGIPSSGLDASAKAPPASLNDTDDPRVYALSAASVRLFSDLGVWQQLRDSQQCPVYEMHVWAAPAQPQALKLNAMSQGRSELCCMVSHQDLIAALRHSVAGIRGQVAPSALNGTDARRLCLVAEGTRSRTRQQLGMKTKRYVYEQVALVGSWRCEHTHGRVARQWFLGEQGVLALLPLADPHVVSMVWSMPSSMAQEFRASHATAQAEQLSALSRGVLGELTWPDAQLRLALSPLQYLMAQDWVCEHDNTRYVLLGDAAHAVHPLAGLGLNLGLGDVACLMRLWSQRGNYWDPHLYHAYVRERQAAAYKVAALTDGLART
ncbi:MAG: hypothetical protein RLZZ502_1166, partial [Pseudomonadota bacterium]